MIGALPATTVTYILYGLSALLPVLLIVTVKIILSGKIWNRNASPTKATNRQTSDSTFITTPGYRTPETLLYPDLASTPSATSQRNVLGGHVTQSTDNPNIYFGPTLATATAMVASTAAAAAQGNHHFHGQGHRMLMTSSPGQHIESGYDSVSSRRDLPSRSTTSGRVSRQSFGSASTIQVGTRRQDRLLTSGLNGSAADVSYNDVGQYQTELADGNGQHLRYHRGYGQPVAVWNEPGAASHNIFIVTPSYESLNETSRHLASESYIDQQMFKYRTRLEHDQEQAIR